jgi:hypothetical protein
MGAVLAEIMEGRATTETRVYDGNGELQERRVQTTSPKDRMQAIDMTYRATTGYAPTRARVALGMENTPMYSSEEWDAVPAIYVDPAALEASATPSKASEPEDEIEDDAEDEESDEGADEDEEYNDEEVA